VKVVSQRCEAELSSWTHLSKELDALNEVGDAVELLRAQMEEMCGQLQVLDAALDGHIQLREEKEMRKWHEGVERDTANFASARERDLQVLEKTLKADMAKKARARQQEQAAAAGAAAAKEAAAKEAAAKEAAAKEAAAKEAAAKEAAAKEAAAKEAAAAKLPQGGGGEETKQSEPEAKEAEAAPPAKEDGSEKEGAVASESAPGEGQAESEGGKERERVEGAEAAADQADPNTASPEEEKDGEE
jgi:hypothetical protein